MEARLTRLASLGKATLYLCCVSISMNLMVLHCFNSFANTVQPIHKEIYKT